MLSLARAADTGSGIAREASIVGTRRKEKKKMNRHFDDWLRAYVKHASFTEAPEHMHYWVGVTILAALLGRRVWWDKKAFKIFPNFYLMVVAPPGVAKKTTTLNQGVQLLKGLGDFHLGPSTVTWQALVKAFKEAECTEELEDGIYEEQANMYIASGEMGSFINPEDRQCMDMLVKLWDGEEVDKQTIGNGNFHIEKPLLSFATCTTPSWIRSSIPQYMIDGGLLSRIVAIYGEKRSKRVALPELAVPKDYHYVQQKLIDDLSIIRTIKGDVTATPECIPILEEQYDRICDAEEEDTKGLLQRKQLQILKLSMILAASTGSTYSGHLMITPELLVEAEEKVDYLEDQRKQVFRFVGKGRQAMLAGTILEIMKKRKSMTAKELYREMYDELPNSKEFVGLLWSAKDAGFIRLRQDGDVTMVLLKEDQI